MIAIPLAGESSRFFNNGYKDFKFFLPLNKLTVIENIISWIPKNEQILFIVLEKHNIKDRLINLFLNSTKKIHVVSIKTSSGQLDSVEKGVRKALKKSYISLDDSLIVFNGDTIRKKIFRFNDYGDWWLETFVGEGTHWSFADKLGVVSKITEKIRISNNCSNGLYSLSIVKVFLNLISDYQVKNDEKYVAPFLNYVLSKGYTVRAFNIKKELLDFCGTPKGLLIYL